MANQSLSACKGSENRAKYKNNNGLIYIARVQKPRPELNQNGANGLHAHATRSAEGGDDGCCD